MRFSHSPARSRSGFARLLPKIRQLAMIVSVFVTIGFIAMFVAGLFTYTSVGIDHDQVEGDRVLAGYWRVRWPGDGSFWIGTAGHWRPVAEKPADAVDLGGVLFRQPLRPIPRSWWNRRGFWRIDQTDSDPFSAKHYPDPVWTNWIAVPGWLPVLVFGGWPVWRLWNNRSIRRNGQVSLFASRG